jgi:hypothetical protein
MKKSRFIALIMVVAIMLMGAGYAEWTDLLTVDAVVCTGEMSVEFIDGKYDGIGVNCDADWVTATLITGTAVETIAVDNMFPGAKVEYVTTVKNMGTIPAKIEDVDITVYDGCGELCAVLGWQARAKRIYYEGGVRKEAVPALFNISGTGLGNLATDLESEFLNKVLPPGDDEYEITIWFGLPCEETGYEDECCEFDFMLHFIQGTDCCD